MLLLILFCFFLSSKSETASNQSSIQIELNNRFNLEYDQTFDIGTPAQSITMVFSTSYSWVQIPSSNCTNCVSSSLFTCGSSSTCSENTTDIIMDDIAIYHVFTDNLYLTSSAEIQNQTMFMILKDLSDSQEEGLIGLGLDGIVAESDSSLLVTLQKQGLIEKKIFAFYFSNSVFSSTITSRITLGGYESELMTTDLSYFSLCNNQSWGINASNFSIGSLVVESSLQTVYIYSEINGLLAPYKSYVTILNYLKQLFETCLTFGEIIRCSCPSGMSAFPTFSFEINSTEFTLEPDYYITEEESVCSLKISSGDSSEEFWVLGIGFLQKYYTVFDAEEMRIGLAEAVKSEIAFALIYEDTIVVGIILFGGFFIGLLVIWCIEKTTKFNELNSNVQEVSY